MTDRRLVLLGPDDGHRARDLDGVVPFVPARRTVFPDGEQLTVVADPARLAGAEVLVVQSTAPPQDSRWEALFQLLDVCAGYGAAAVDCFIPYLSYGRQDRRTPPGAALTGPLQLRIARALGAGRVFTVDRHSPAGPEDLPVLDLDPTGLFAAALRDHDVKAELVVSADRGGAGRAARLATALDIPYRVLDKTKDGTGTHYPALPDGMAGSVVVVDDVCSSGSTLVPLVRALSAAGGVVTAVAVTHLLTGPERLRGRLAGGPVLLYSDSASTGDAALPVLPAAIRAWWG